MKFDCFQLTESHARPAACETGSQIRNPDVQDVGNSLESVDTVHIDS